METFDDYYGRGKWVVIDRSRGEIVGTHSTRKLAHAGCRADLGRRLEVQDPIGRLDSLWCDGEAA